VRRAIGGVVVLGLCVAVAAVTANPHEASGRPFLEIGRAHRAEHTPALTGDRPIFVLILGSDSRPGTALEDGLCDSIHILGINPKRRSATLIGIPRDSYVPLASGGTNKINSAMPAGGLDAMIATVERLSGIRFDYYALSGFDEMIGAVNEIGGLTIDVPYSFTGYRSSFQAGQAKLDGKAALELARTRKGLQTGDFDRSMNQGRILMAALAQFRKQFGRDPSTMFTWLGAGMRGVHTDLSIDELITLSFTATNISPKRVTNLVLMGTNGLVGTMSVVNLSSTANQPLFRDIAADGFIRQQDIPAQAQPANGT
jgi:polyisoprenyl-teichoic acid--peptidoglycan teichoic acid transferase